jgi:PP-loop superfamily ATP-utilizing enzyme
MGHRIENDCLALLSHVSKHRMEPQTIQGLADECGIKEDTLSMILSNHRHHGDKPCYLCKTASHYRYEFYVYKDSVNGKIIDV